MGQNSLEIHHEIIHIEDMNLVLAVAQNIDVVRDIWLENILNFVYVNVYIWIWRLIYLTAFLASLMVVIALTLIY
jgi:hypothetical protein